MSKIYGGVDPGFTGGISFIEVNDKDELIQLTIIPMPVIKTIECGETKTRLNYKDLDEMFKYFKDKIVMMTIEKQQPMRSQIYGKDQNGNSILVSDNPQGVSSTGKIMEQYGAIKMCALSNGIEHQLVGAQKWQKHIFNPCRKYGTKKTSIETAKLLYPTANLIPDRARVEKNGLSDSLLIGHYGRMLAKANGGGLLYERS